MATKKKGKREKIKMKSSKSAHFYTTTKNKSNTPSKLELKMFDPFTGQHEMYKEDKIK
jgi:large subunit ribosomal protein L33